jgi:protein ImuA
VLPLHKIPVLEALQKQVALLNGVVKPLASMSVPTGLQPLMAHFAGGVFPAGVVHEMVVTTQQQQAATHGFLAGVIAQCLPANGVVVWVGTGLQVFPAGLAYWGLQPHKHIFIQPQNAKQVNWVIEEALQCSGITAVVASSSTAISFTNSRRFQLAAEKTNVTGFIQTQNSTGQANACYSRWLVQPAKSIAIQGLPGVGSVAWQVQLQKIRNGKVGKWQVQWAASEQLLVVPTVQQLMPPVSIPIKKYA